MTNAIQLLKEGSNISLASAEQIESVLIQGDLSKLDAKQRVTYYNSVCASLGLNPLTKPFEYTTLNGKLLLYAKKDCAEQLRRINRISIEIVSRTEANGIFTVVARAKDTYGRVDESSGSIVVANLKPTDLANAFMKAETKAKRRVTLSICGLGMLDETELDSIPAGPAQSKADLLNNRSQPGLEFTEAEVPSAEHAGDLGDYVLKVGYNKGKKLSEIDDAVLLKSLNWIYDDAERPLGPLLIETREKIEAYLKQRGGELK